MNAQFFAISHVLKCQCGSNTFRHHLTYRQNSPTDTSVVGVTDACTACGIAYTRDYAAPKEFSPEDRGSGVGFKGSYTGPQLKPVV